MQYNKWNRIEPILDTALTLSGEERTSFIIDACGNDKEMLKDVYEIMEAIEESEKTAFLEDALFENSLFVKEVSDFSSTAQHSFIGEKVGAFEITEPLGTGGMGTVYKAERIDGQFSQEVAIKTLKKGIQSQETLRRFRREQEILASLKHPNIAQLYDGGITDDGTPYLIMEYVDGVQIDQYCDHHKLTIDKRIELFTKVCSALQFAHANLVIHRDLKASNIYVNSEGNVKVLDFGIAKLLDPKLTEQTLLETRPGQRFWTPQYAAPEQVKGKNITTATDVYALGVLLHKLLTGTYPLELNNKSLAEIEQIIAEQAPIPPSKSLKESNKTADLRKSTPNELKKMLSGDLDALVLKTLRKEPEYRYSSVGQFLEELDRHQNGMPLMAHKDTIPYKVGKFYRRHKTGIAVSAIMFLFISGLSGLYTWKIAQERNVASLQAEKAEQTAQFLTDLFAQSSPQHAEKANMTARELLDAGTDNIFSQLSSQPALKAKMLTVTGEAYLNIELFDKADSLASKGVQILQNESDDKLITDLAYGQLITAKVKLRKAEFDEAEKFARSALANYERTKGKSSPEVRQCVFVLSNILHEKGNWAEARTKMEEWASTDISTKHKIDIADKLVNEAQMDQMMGGYEIAEKKLRKALALRTDIYGEMHAATAVAMDRLSSVLMSGHNFSAEAESLLRRAVEINESEYETHHTEWALSLNNLARVLKLRGEYTEAKKLFAKGIDMLEEIRGSKHPYTLIQKYEYADLLLETNQLNAAKKLFTKIAATYKQKFGNDYLLSIMSREQLALILTKEKQFRASSSKLLEVIKDYNNKYGPKAERSAMARRHYGYVLLQLGNTHTAEKWIAESVNILSESDSNRKWKLALAERTLGLLRLEQKRITEAENLLKSSYDFFEQTRGPNSNYTKESLNYLIKLYEEWKKPSKIQEYQVLMKKASK